MVDWSRHEIFLVDAEESGLREKDTGKQDSGVG